MTKKNSIQFYIQGLILTSRSLTPRTIFFTLLSSPKIVWGVLKNLISNVFSACLVSLSFAVLYINSKSRFLGLGTPESYKLGIKQPDCKLRFKEINKSLHVSPRTLYYCSQYMLFLVMSRIWMSREAKLKSKMFVAYFPIPIGLIHILHKISHIIKLNQEVFEDIFATF